MPNRILPPLSGPACAGLTWLLLIGCGGRAPASDASPCSVGCPDAAVGVPGQRSPNETGDLGDGGSAAGDADAATADGLAAPGFDAGMADLSSGPDAPAIVDAVGLGDESLGALDLAARPDGGPMLGLDAAPPPDLTALPPDSTPLPADVSPPPDLPPPPDLLPPADAAPLLPDAGNGCPATGRGPAMVRAELAARPFCVDATEVTNVQYAAFLDATGGGTQTGGQPAACSWNTSFVPSSSDLAWPYAPGKENHPVVNVDWCDAQAFCKWSGKRLCGKVGGGGLTGWAAGGDTTSSQWASACSRAGQRQYPYGSSWDARACNTAAPAEKAQYIADVMHFPGCEGGSPGIFDMTGNVEEWVDACDKNTGATDQCASAGASTYEVGLAPADVTCTESVYNTPRNTQYFLLGFRCCADL